MTLGRRRRSLAGLGCVLVPGWIAAAALLPVAPDSGAMSHELLAGRAHGKLAVKNSLDGVRIVSGTNLTPGDSEQGSVWIKNVGAGARLELSKRRLRDWLGPNGGALSHVLCVRVFETRRRVPGRRVGRSRSLPRQIHGGRLAKMPAVDLGPRWRVGEARRYRFEVRWPNHGLPRGPARGDNEFQASRTRTTFVWRAR